MDQPKDLSAVTSTERPPGFPVRSSNEGSNYPWLVLTDYDGDGDYDEMWFQDIGQACDYARHASRELGVVTRVFKLTETALYEPPHTPVSLLNGG